MRSTDSHKGVVPALKIEINKLKKYYNDRLILEIANLKIYSGEKIAVVGDNGAGKSTFLNIIAGLDEPDSGFVKTSGEISYIRQLEYSDDGMIPGRLSKEMGVARICPEDPSGGEIARIKLAASLSRGNQILIADEPASNLDIKGIELLERYLCRFEGTLLLVSHDRELLNKTCSAVIEIDSGAVTRYPGNYDSYIAAKEMAVKRQNFEYESYVSEKRRLEKAVVEKKQHVKNMRKAPKRMGNSEARLHTRGVNGKKAKLDRSTKAIVSRIEGLEKKEKAKTPPKVFLDAQKTPALHSKLAASAAGLDLALGERRLFNSINFEVPSAKKTALIGDNGSGKTTLIKMIVERDPAIRVSSCARIGYFSQSLDILDPGRAVLENAMAESVYPESFARLILARLLFREDAVMKKAGCLSGGEKVKAAFACIFLKDVNFLVLDEPTNYLDAASIAALAEMIRDYEGTVLFASHDRSFVNKTADRIIILQNGSALTFEGNYEEYSSRDFRVDPSGVSPA